MVSLEETTANDNLEEIKSSQPSRMNYQQSQPPSSDERGSSSPQESSEVASKSGVDHRCPPATFFYAEDDESPDSDPEEQHDKAAQDRQPLIIHPSMNFLSGEDDYSPDPEIEQQHDDAIQDQPLRNVSPPARPASPFGDLDLAGMASEVAERLLTEQFHTQWWWHEKPRLYGLSDDGDDVIRMPTVAPIMLSHYKRSVRRKNDPPLPPTNLHSAISSEDLTAEQSAQTEEAASPSMYVPKSGFDWSEQEEEQRDPELDAYLSANGQQPETQEQDETFGPYESNDSEPGQAAEQRNTEESIEQNLEANATDSNDTSDSTSKLVPREIDSLQEDANLNTPPSPVKSDASVESTTGMTTEEGDAFIEAYNSDASKSLVKQRSKLIDETLDKWESERIEAMARGLEAPRRSPALNLPEKAEDRIERLTMKVHSYRQRSKKREQEALCLAAKCNDLSDFRDRADAYIDDRLHEIQILKRQLVDSRHERDAFERWAEECNALAELERQRRDDPMVQADTQTEEDPREAELVALRAELAESNASKANLEEENRRLRELLTKVKDFHERGGSPEAVTQGESAPAKVIEATGVKESETHSTSVEVESPDDLPSIAAKWAAAREAILPQKPHWAARQAAALTQEPYKSCLVKLKAIRDAERAEHEARFEQHREAMSKLFARSKSPHASAREGLMLQSVH